MKRRKKISRIAVVLAMTVIFSVNTSQVNAGNVITHTVNFDYNDGTGDATTTEVAEGTLIRTPPEPDRAGYKFLGWASVFDGDTPILWDFKNEVMPSSNITLWAAYAKEYTTNFDYNDGTGNATTTEVAEGALLPTPPEPDRAGYKFLGWASAFDGDTPILWDFKNEVMPSFNITLWAAYTKEYITIFDYNDGTGNTITTEVAEGALIPTPLEPDRAGYKFLGWAFAFDGDTPILWDFKSEVMPSFNITLWAAYAKEYKTIFDYNDGTGNATITEVAEGALIPTPPEPDRAGYKFLGWAFAFYGDTPILWDFKSEVMPSFNITLWAAYAKEYTANFDYNDGTGKAITTEVAEGELIPTPLEPDRAGYKFLGWASAFDGDTPILWDFENKVMPSSNITLLAVYEKNKDLNPTTNPDNGNNNNTSSKDYLTRLPQTSDSSSILVMMILLSGSLIIGGYVLTRRKEQKQ